MRLGNRAFSSRPASAQCRWLFEAAARRVERGRQNPRAAAGSLKQQLAAAHRGRCRAGRRAGRRAAAAAAAAAPPRPPRWKPVRVAPRRARARAPRGGGGARQAAQCRELADAASAALDAAAELARREALQSAALRGRDDAVKEAAELRNAARKAAERAARWRRASARRARRRARLLRQAEAALGERGGRERRGGGGAFARRAGVDRGWARQRAGGGARLGNKANC